LGFAIKCNIAPSETEDIDAGGTAVLKVVAISSVSVSSDVERIRGGRKWW
jgi:hypothetical protein